MDINKWQSEAQKGEQSSSESQLRSCSVKKESSSSESTTTLFAEPHSLYLAENRNCQKSHGCLLSSVTGHREAVISRSLVLREIIRTNALRWEGWRGGSLVIMSTSSRVWVDSGAPPRLYYVLCWAKGLTSPSLMDFEAFFCKNGGDNNNSIHLTVVKIKRST